MSEAANRGVSIETLLSIVVPAEQIASFCGCSVKCERVMTEPDDTERGLVISSEIRAIEAVEFIKSNVPVTEVAINEPVKRIYSVGSMPIEFSY